MGLPVRNLDNRRFQDVVNEAKELIVASCPEWTDHNVSDPGVTMIELFAWMTEMIIYRLNQIPERNYIKFLDLLGIKLQAPKPAKTSITFYLSAPQANPILLEKGREVATVRTETEPAIIFSTEGDFEIRPAELDILQVEEISHDEADFHLLDHKNLNLVNVFGVKPQIGNALYLGFKNDVSHHVLALEIDCKYAAPGGLLDPKNPPWQWEGWVDSAQGEQAWKPAVVEEDSTEGMSQSGRIIIRLQELTRTEINNKLGFWVRCRVMPVNGASGYEESPQVNSIEVYTWGATVKAVHASVVANELLGRSDGSPGQVFQIENTPLLKREREDEIIEILPPDQKEWKAWREVTNFAESGESDNVYTCDSVTGEVRFGPALVDPKGRVRTYGAIPPRESQIRFRAYRYGGGVIGNVRKKTLTVLKTSIPYIDRVVNYEDARGGLNQETIELAQLRAPQYLSSRGRAVTAKDYESLVKEEFPELARVRCVPADPGTGTIYILLVPKVSQPYGYISEEALRIDDWRNRVRTHLDERRLLTVRLDVSEPVYNRVAVDITVVANANVDRDRVYQDVEARLYRYLNPIVGGPDGTGWPFGRDLSPFDISVCLQTVSGIESIQSLRLYGVVKK